MAPRSLSTVRGASLALLAALGCLSGASYTDPRTGIAIHLEGSAVLFPQGWLSPEIDAKATSLDPAETARTAEVIKRAMALYPAPLLRRHLRSVYAAKELTFFGVAYGGTNSMDAVYVTNNGIPRGYTDRFIAEVFHHEFSSILLRNAPEHFDVAAWNSTSRPGFKYGNGGTEAIRQGEAETAYRAKYNVDGFLNQYATSSLEEDFNSFAEALFSGDRTFWVLVDRYPRLAQKKDLAVAFYNRLDPQFDEDFFRNLTKQ